MIEVCTLPHLGLSALRVFATDCLNTHSQNVESFASKFRSDIISREPNTVPAPCSLHPAYIFFQAVLWTGAGVSSCFLLLRLIVRYATFRKLCSDDVMMIAAWLMLLSSTILWQTQTRALYDQYAVVTGEVPFDLGFLERYSTFLHSVAPLGMLFYTCLWTIKLSLLLFFRSIGAQVNANKAWWWFVWSDTVLTWMGCMGANDWGCSSESFADISCGFLSTSSVGPC
jgi:hypothetical protein